MDLVLVDSAVVVGFLDGDDALHDAADRRLRELVAAGGPIGASVVTVAELLTGAKRGHHDVERVRRFFGSVIPLVLGVDRPIAEVASDLRSASSALRLPDALILATAQAHDADLVITADRRWRGVRGLTSRIELLAA